MRTVNSKYVNENLTLELERDPNDWNYARIKYLWRDQGNVAYFRIHSRDRIVICVDGVMSLTDLERELIRDSGYILKF